MTASIDDGGLIQQSDSGWLIQVGTQHSELPFDAPPEQIVQRLIEAYEAVGRTDKRCVLALASSECFFTDFEPPDSVDPKDRTAVTFELERHFPLDAEAMVSDYSVDPSSRRIAAVAIESDRQVGITRALENLGVEIVAIVPATFLIARATERWREEQTPFKLFLIGPASAETLLVDSDGVRQWKQFSGADDELRRYHAITADPSDSSRTTVVVGQKELAIQPDGPAEWCDRSVAQLLTEGAAVALRGRWGRWPDFRRGDLAPSDPLYAVARPLRMLALAAILCFVIISCAAWYRSSRAVSESETVRDIQRSEFLEAFPGRRVPVLLMRTVRSEYSKTLGSRGRGDSIKLPVPATTVLENLFRGLEHAKRIGGARYRLIDLNILDGECSLTVRAQDAIQIGTIAKSLETVGFQVAPPASEQIDPSKDEPMATYQSTITAVWTVDAAEPENKPANRDNA